MNNIIEVKWGTSKGRYTYGYKTCALYYNNNKVAYCSGGGYDMRGTVIGNLIAKLFSKEIIENKSELENKNLYGLNYTEDNRFYIDGACGFNSMSYILKELGYKLNMIKENSKNEMYMIEKIS